MSRQQARIDRPTFAPKFPRGEGEHLRFSGMEVLVRASAESTGGAFTVCEEINPIDVPRHVHHDRDELFYVLEGEHLFTVGDTRYAAGPGDLVFGPRGVPHAQQRVVPRVGRVLTLFAPAGFEGFFRELAAADMRGKVNQALLDGLAAQYGAAWV
jgi:mannose-6-phosphate isomerase-like protein (cupin superfamily)